MSNFTRQGPAGWGASPPWIICTTTVMRTLLPADGARRQPESPELDDPSAEACELVPAGLDPLRQGFDLLDERLDDALRRSRVSLEDLPEAVPVQPQAPAPFEDAGREESGFADEHREGPEAVSRPEHLDLARFPATLDPPADDAVDLRGG